MQRTLWAALVVAALLAGGPAAAQYNRTPESEIDSGIFRIDEMRHLGVRLDRDLPLLDAEGRPFRLGDLAGMPLVVVLAYYQCDGTCSVINRELKALLEEVTAARIGRDFRVLTISFDRNDTVETVAAFRRGLDLSPEMRDGWFFALPADAERMRRFTDSIGYKYFWSPRDRTFFHPGVFVVASPEGRVVRFLYSQNVAARDVSLALMDAAQDRIAPGDIINYAVSLCFSYNYAEGRYTYNIPLFVAMGSLALGATSFAAGLVYYRRRRSREAPI